VKYDLVDRRCVVTGATSGIGKEIARNLAYFGASVVIACRDRDKGSATLQELADDSGNDRLTLMEVNLAQQASIRQFAHRVASGDAPVHVLVNCAGIFEDERQLSLDGHELTWATNALSYFMLTNLLLPALDRSAPARVVNVASKTAGNLDLEDLDFDRRRFSGITAYMQSKQANRMLTWGLAARIRQERISVHACHPGAVATRLYDNQRGIKGTIARFSTKFMKTPAQGALTPTFLAADPDVHAHSGKFWVDRKPVPRKFTDAAAIDALWAACVQMTRTNVG
jgi:NAD(P)-dependent dehydrogenase (short-subunit alcohol dehydrogenase family)